MGKQLKNIEKGTYSSGQFIHSMKKMVDQLVCDVRLEKKKLLSIHSDKVDVLKKNKATNNITNQLCPSCKKGKLIKGKTAYGCSNFNSRLFIQIRF